MLSLLARLFLRPENKTEEALRKGYGVLCAALGIGLNLLLFLGKLLAGLLSGSIAVTADAFNNLSDTGSSFVTALGFCLADRKPDAGHPFGHGRMEYLSGLAVSMLIVLMGFELVKSSLAQILRPAPVEAGGTILVILGVSIAVKLYMAFYNRRLGRRLKAPVLLAASVDSLCDCAATAAVLLATLAGRFTGAAIDGWAGLLVAGFILFSGFKSAKDTIDPLLGTPPTAEFVGQIRELVLSFPGIIGVHDLVVHDYGPGRVMISLHAEVSSAGDVMDLHDRIDSAERALREQLGCHAVIHMDPVAADGGITQAACRRVAALVSCIDEGISIHDFRMVPGPTHTSLVFDAVVPFGFRLTDREVAERIQTAVRTLDESWQAVVQVERSYT